MYIFQRLGFYGIRCSYSVFYFFEFLGYLGITIKRVVLGQRKFPWHDFFHGVYHALSLLVVPLIFLGVLISATLELNVYMILKHFNMQQHAIIRVQGMVVRDILPGILAIILCIRFALNMITVKTFVLKSSPYELMINHILPRMLIICITAILLFPYFMMAALITTYIVAKEVLSINVTNYLLLLSDNLSIVDLFSALLKLTVLTLLVSIIAGFYYYKMSVGHLALRKVVSRIMTRGIVWIIVCNVWFKLIHL